MESSDRAKALERVRDIERMQALDWLIDHLEETYNKVAEILTAGSVYNESIYQSLFNKLEEWLKLKREMKDNLEIELSLPAEDRGELTPQLIGEVGEKQNRIKEIRDSLTNDEIIILQTLMNDKYVSEEVK